MTKKSPPKDLLEWLGITDSPNWRVARPLGIIISGLLALLILGAFVAAFTLLGRTIQGGFDTAAGNLGAGALIVAILGAPFLVWGTVIKQKTLDLERSKADLDRETRYSDRIYEMSKQLGAEKNETQKGRKVKVVDVQQRTAALVWLERFAQDSTEHDKGRDHVRVMEILCAYVRENAPAKDAIDFPAPDWEPPKGDATEEERAAHLAAREDRFGDYFGESKAWTWAQKLEKPRADIQQALDILGRRTEEQRRIEARWGKDAAPNAEWVFDTPCPSLPNERGEAPLSSDALEAFKSKLAAWKKKIRSYQGYRLDLRRANLQGADLSEAILSGARLKGARLEGADLGRARLEGANLGRARLEGADLGGARLEGALLGRARLEGADLGGARLEGAFLGGARLEGADLGGARLEGAFLGRARLDSATNMTDALLRGASVRFVDDTATLTQLAPFLPDMFGDGSVELPEGTPRPAHWPDWGLPDRGPNAFKTQWKLWLSNPKGYEPPKKPAD